MSQKLFESFSWVVPFETGATKGKKVIIRGKALHATVSGNLRKYIDEEITLSARSLASKYIDVNHEYSLWGTAKAKYDAGESLQSPGPKPKLKGNVIDAEHEQGHIEYVGEVNDREYAEKLIDRERLTEAAYIKKWGKPPIRHVSVDANYRFHKEKDGLREPHGLIFNGLSMVEYPAQPGVEGTSIDVMEIREVESVDSQFTLLQNVLLDKGILSEVKTVHGEKVLTEIIISDEIRAQREYQITAEAWKELAPAMRLNYISRLPAREVVAEPEPIMREEADALKTLEPSLPVDGNHSDASPPMLEKLQLGEPFAGYTDFASCVAANRDKEDPEAYCATIMRKVEGNEKSKETRKVTVEVSDRGAEELKHLKEHDEIRENVTLVRNIIEGYGGDVASHGKAIKSVQEETRRLMVSLNSVIESVNTGHPQFVEELSSLGHRVQALCVKLDALQIPDVAPLEAKISEIKVPDLTPYALKESIPVMPDLTVYALKEDVPTMPDLTPYALKESIPVIPDLTPIEEQCSGLDARITALETAENKLVKVTELFNKVMEKEVADRKLSETQNSLEARISVLEESRKTEFKIGAKRDDFVAKGDKIKPAGRSDPVLG